jgi:bifunctional UDP-N-acetylglucosamine pyrophosphorylase/glucosamine-1-phosphate N-acetyltransferase
MPLEAIVLAAGQGKRMRSALPKVLHGLAGKPLLAHVLEAARGLAPSRIVVVHGHGAEAVKARFPESDLAWALQSEQLGTGHAVMQALPQIARGSDVVVLNGDMPLIRPASLVRLANAAGDGLAILTAEFPQTPAYGRVVRDSKGRLLRIVEERDASPQEQAIRECYVGYIACSRERLENWLGRVGTGNSQQEYYLTDVIALAVADGVDVATVRLDDHREAFGVNSRHDLAIAERAFQNLRAQALLEAGVTLADLWRVDVRGELACGSDVFIDVNCVFEGKVSLGDGVRIGPNCVLRNVSIAAGTEIHAFSLLEDAEVGARCRVGPYARLRPGAQLAEDVHIGNFVEVKASRIGAGSKANHLAYIGDSEVGSGVNIGAGTITCNYDGATKHRTVIEDDCFIGSDTTLVAPVTVAKGSYIGAGSTISKDTPAGQLTLARAKQTSIPGWKPPRKKAP